MTNNQEKNIKMVKRVQLLFGVITAIIVIIVLLVINSEAWINTKLKKEVTAELDKVQVHLQNYFDDHWAYPAPDSWVSILVWKWNFVYFQGYLWETVKDLISLDDELKYKYTYSVTHSRDKYKLVYFAWNNKIISAWDTIWVFVNSKNIPFQDVDYALGDITKTEEPYTVYLDDNLKITWGANDMKRIKAIAAYDYDADLLAYYDMETLSDSWKLFDLSWNENHWKLFWDLEIWWEVDWKFGSSTYLDWVDDYINIDALAEKLATKKDFSITYSFKTNKDFTWYIPTISANSKWEAENIFRLWVQSENKFFFTVWSFDKKRLYFNWNVADGEWHTVSFSYDSINSSITIYIDWELRQTFKTDEKTAEVLASAWALSIGQEYDVDENWEYVTSDFFEWEVDEIFVHSRLLNSDDIEKFHTKK